eukprot:gene12164-14238_t
MTTATRSCVLDYPRTLYPPIEPFLVQRLKVSEIHDLHVEESGNATGKPVIVVHGGPGGGCEPFYRQFFDPSVYRIIMFDQRGCGKSTPFACLEENTTWDLVRDMEKIRNLLSVDSWMVFGGSWGSTLALAYAETHPDRVKALVLRDYFEPFREMIPEVERGDLMSAYHRRLTGTDEEAKRKCADAWTRWEMATSKLIVDPAKIEEGDFALAFARIECHYFVNGGFFAREGQLIADAHILSKIPGVIVQGRYDVVCPAKSAWELHKAWPISELKIISDSGHSVSEPGIISALVEACDKFRTL